MCLDYVYISLLKYNCFRCVVCGEQQLKFGLSAHNYDSKWSTTQSFSISECTTPKKALKNKTKI